MDPIYCVDPERCKQCPPDRVCAWACEQGLSPAEVLARDSVRVPTVAGGLPNLPDTDCIRQALWESFND